MKIFTKEIIVSEEHLDFNNHVNNIVYLEWAVDLSREHWQSVVSESMLENFFWVVRSHHIEYKKQAFEGDKIKLETYVENIRGPFSERHVKISKADELLVIVKSEWCFLEKITQKIKRVPEEVEVLFL